MKKIILIFFLLMTIVSCGSGNDGSSQESLSQKGVGNKIDKIVNQVKNSNNYSPLKKTGQKLIYADYDDGFYEVGVVNEYTRNFNNETVTDLTTGLTWQDNIAVREDSYTWENGNNYCKKLNFAGYDDWRLPSPKEIITIRNLDHHDPSIDPIFLNTTYSYNYRSTRHYWTDETNSNNAGYACTMSFNSGDFYWKKLSNKQYVRCVRGKTLDYSPDFTRIGEIVVDKKTGLVWQDSSDVVDLYHSWNDAISYCENLHLGGYNDWRLPNDNELISILDFSLLGTRIDPVFRNVDNNRWYWSSSTFSDGNNRGWSKSFYSGYSGYLNKSDLEYCRCVRGGK